VITAEDSAFILSFIALVYHSTSIACSTLLLILPLASK